MIRVFWRHCDDNVLDTDYLRCDWFTLEDAISLIELSKKVNYIKISGEEDGQAFKFCSADLVLGNPENGLVDYINIVVDNNPF